MTTTQTDLIPGNPRIGQNTDAVVGDGLLHSRKLTVPEAAKALGIGETKMRGLIKDGAVPVIRILGKILLLEADLEDFLRGHYGALRRAEKMSHKLPSLPEYVTNSGLLKKSA